MNLTEIYNSLEKTETNTFFLKSDAKGEVTAIKSENFKNCGPIARVFKEFLLNLQGYKCYSGKKKDLAHKLVNLAEKVTAQKIPMLQKEDYRSGIVSRINSILKRITKKNISISYNNYSRPILDCLNQLAPYNSPAAQRKQIL